MVKYCNYNHTLKRNINASFSLINLDQFQLNHIISYASELNYWLNKSLRVLHMYLSRRSREEGKGRRKGRYRKLEMQTLRGTGDTSREIDIFLVHVFLFFFLPFFSLDSKQIRFDNILVGSKIFLHTFFFHLYFIKLPLIIIIINLIISIDKNIRLF